jgi:hypothetical protein
MMMREMRTDERWREREAQKGRIKQGLTIRAPVLPSEVRNMEEV